MKSNTALFELIKSLSSNEKRYFKLFASLQKGNKSYVLLFDAIDTQSSYDEKALKAENPELVHNFAFTKNYLYNIIFRCLSEYHSECSIDCKIQGLINRCKILFRKSLYKQYFETLKKAKSLALKYERFGYYMEILEMDKMVTKKEILYAIGEDKLYEEAIGILDKLKNNYEYSRIIRKLLGNYRRIGMSRIDKHSELIKEILSEKFMKSIDEAASDKAKIAFYRITDIINKMEADYESSLITAEKQIEIVEENPFPFEDSIINAMNEAVISSVFSNIKLGNTRKADSLLRKLKESGTFDIADIEVTAGLAELEINIKSVSINEAIKLIPALEIILVKYENKIELDYELIIRFKIIVTLILSENFTEALRKINLFLSHPLISSRADLECYTRILNLIVHYEMKNYELMPYLIRSTYHFLLKSEKLYKLEYLFLSFLRKLTTVKNNDELTFELISAKKELSKIKNDKFEKNAFEYFDFPLWIDKKLENKAYFGKSEEIVFSL